jgi:DNA-binding HxlR family transcriptional regulator
VANRTYNDRCGIARALDAVGDRWALLVVRELLLGPKRFTDLRAGLPRVSPDVLAQRLRELEAAGVLRRDTLPPPAASQVYELTERGRELKTVILELGRWGSREPPNDGPLGPDAAVIALMTMFRGGLEGTFELRLDGHAFALTAADGQLDARTGPAPDPAAVIEGAPGTLASVLWHGADPRQLTLTGDARRFLRAFQSSSAARR